MGIAVGVLAIEAWLDNMPGTTVFLGPKKAPRPDPAGDGPLRDPPGGTPHQEVQGEPCLITGQSPGPPATGVGARDHQSQWATTAEVSTGGQAPAGRPQSRPRRGLPIPLAPKAEQGLSAPGREGDQPRAQGRGGRGPIRPLNRPTKATPPPRPAPAGARMLLTRCAPGGTRPAPQFRRTSSATGPTPAESASSPPVSTGTGQPRFRDGRVHRHRQPTIRLVERYFSRSVRRNYE
ncbi:hypothetical protein NDU88_003027 [Pleurodeles waltl]|uniref:Uncharacterized protein n=1 Tax=Pleurodeles waltl TaxID=8319 RepID=A0AAV7LHC8_PLEWA|nr:hypothetical protein NDU88_003027 [Pleurodeles waltl]